MSYTLNKRNLNFDVTKFTDPEQLWFWFIGRKFSAGLPGTVTSNRICAPIDIETMVTRMYLAGKLGDEQLAVMKEFGDRRRAPSPHIWAENRKASLWRSGMEALQTEAIKKGWIE